MNSKKQIQIFSLTVLGTLLMVGFQNCSPLKFTPASSKEMMKSATQPMSEADGDYIVPAPLTDSLVAVGAGDSEDSSAGNGDFPAEAFSGACEIFDGVTLPLQNVSSLAAFSTSSNSGDLVVPASGSVAVRNQAGHVLISAAENVILANIAGGLQVNTNTIVSVENVAGAICLHSMKIGRVSNVAGGTKILASMVDQIENIGETIHIYGAVVKSVRNVAGQICLHDGARVLDQRNIAGFVGECP